MPQSRQPMKVTVLPMMDNYFMFNDFMSLTVGIVSAWLHLSKYTISFVD